MPRRCVTVGGRASMVGHAPRYPSSYDSDAASYEEKTIRRPAASYEVGPSLRANYAERSVPLFLSDRDGTPDPSEYQPPQRKVKLGSYYTSRILAGVVGGAVLAVIAALVSSDSAREFI